MCYSVGNTRQLNFLLFRLDIGQISPWKVVINVKNISIMKNLTV